MPVMPDDDDAWLLTEEQGRQLMEMKAPDWVLAIRGKVIGAPERTTAVQDILDLMGDEEPCQPI